MQYLTADELAALVGCQPNQVAVMVRWLERERWPYARDRMGFPKVARAYHDQRMTGKAEAREVAAGPNFAALLRLQASQSGGDS